MNIRSAQLLQQLVHPPALAKCAHLVHEFLGREDRK